ncbi:MAG: hypothetical protein COV45_06035 [Deltaproteobacteria bacterium CG11_big_fil_rev_8_21_14_0_20_47_16]|nr:MAG: hypothetical protein COV45_06035 [Deltaproteobacteria bacterium CG11_big_fil_rev_8_21_14_0_20_47_16]
MVSKTHEVLKVLNGSMGRVLDLAEASLPESQFKAFRKMVMDIFGDARRSLRVHGAGLDWCGENKSIEEGVVDYE